MRGATHYDITIGNDIVRDAHCDITMCNDVTMNIHSDVTMSNDITMYTYVTIYTLQCIILRWQTFDRK